MLTEPAFTLGIEEEYWLVDPATAALVREPPKGLMPALEAALGSRVSPEFLRCQIEIGTGVCATLAQARQELIELRGTVARIAGAHDLTIIGASTHPFADWAEQTHTDKERYHKLAQDLQGVVRRLLISGMHVHCGIHDDDLRIDLMTQARYFLPHLLALSTSSPFWGGEPTGLRSYRVCVFDELPRTGLPPELSSFAEYTRITAMLTGTGIIEDATKIWWDIRPSHRFPTLEMRICDLCPLMDDALAIAATYRCILRMLYRLRRQNQRWRNYPNVLIEENRWRAQRYGTDAPMIDFGRGALVPFAALTEELIGLVAEDAAHLCCEAEVAHLRTIVARGTSAARQLAVYEAALLSGADREAALRAVVAAVIGETRQLAMGG